MDETISAGSVDVGSFVFISETYFLTYTYEASALTTIPRSKNTLEVGNKTLAVR